MADQFISEIRIFPFALIPSGWLPCDGRALQISDRTYAALFTLLGTEFGLDGRGTFCVPNLLGAVPMGTGTGAPNRTNRFLAQKGGKDRVTLNRAELPSHGHAVANQGPPGDSSAPLGNTFARAVGATPYVAGDPNTTMGLEAIGEAGEERPHNNLQPYLALTFCIAYQGQFPGPPPPP